MEKLAQPGEGGGCTPTPFHYIYHHVQNCVVCSSCEGRYTSLISTLSLNVLCDLSHDISNIAESGQGRCHIRPVPTYKGIKEATVRKLAPIPNPLRVLNDYRGPGFLAAVWFGSSPPPPLLSHPSVSSTGDTQEDWKKRPLADGWGRRWGRSRIIRPWEILGINIIQYSLHYPILSLHFPPQQGSRCEKTLILLFEKEVLSSGRFETHNGKTDSEKLVIDGTNYWNNLVSYMYSIL